MQLIIFLDKNYVCKDNAAIKRILKLFYKSREKNIYMYWLTYMYIIYVKQITRRPFVDNIHNFQTNINPLCSIVSLHTPISI